MPAKVAQAREHLGQQGPHASPAQGHGQCRHAHRTERTDKVVGVAVEPDAEHQRQRGGHGQQRKRGQVLREHPRDPERLLGGQRVAGQTQAQVRAAGDQHRGAVAHRRVRPGSQALRVELQAVEAVAHGQLQLALVVRGDAEVVGGGVRVVEHQVVVERAAHTQRPFAHRHDVAHTAVAVEHFEQGQDRHGCFTHA